MEVEEVDQADDDALERELGVSFTELTRQTTSRTVRRCGGEGGRVWTACVATCALGWHLLRPQRSDQRAEVRRPQLRV